MSHKPKFALGLLCLAATFLVGMAYTAHAIPMVNQTPTGSNSDQSGPCSGSDPATQTGDCDSVAGDTDNGQAGNKDNGQVGDTDNTEVEA